ncbi:MAG: ABC transporter permease [Actinomycetota bacterium]
MIGTTAPTRSEPPGAPSPVGRIIGLGATTRQALLLPTLAFITALVIGAIIIAFTDIEALRLFGTDPGGSIGVMMSGISTAYRALFRGAVGSIYAISESLFAATSLTLASLGVALGFRAGLFNIGGLGQMIIGAIFAVWVGLYMALPGTLHIPLALLAGVLGGMIWGGFAGLLKARTGAHEVITTIMLNFVALFFIQWVLTTRQFQDPGRNNPVSAVLQPTTHLPRLFGSSYRVTIAFLVALAMVFVVHWLLFRTSVGFEFRVLGLNQQAGRYAGMSVSLLVTLAMALAGGLAGMAGANQVMGLEPYKASPAVAGSVGFDAITVALLGRSNPVGVLWSALLFGALKAGGREMQGAAQIPLDLVVVLQALIVMFVAAPELVRAVYRLKGRDEQGGQMTRGWGA